MLCVRQGPWCSYGIWIYFPRMQLVLITANVVSKSRSWRGVLDTTLNDKD